MLATSYHNVNMPNRQTSFNPEWTKEHTFKSKSSRDAFHGFCTLSRSEVRSYKKIKNKKLNLVFEWVILSKAFTPDVTKETFT